MAMSAIINHYRIEDRDVSEHRCPFCSYEWLEWSDADDYPYYCPSCGENFDGEETVVKYFSTRRPLAPGSCPDAGLAYTEDFGKKVFCPEIGREAWGYAAYGRELTEEETRLYELTPEGRKIWHCVVTSFYDDGRVTANIVATKEADERPGSKRKRLSNKAVLSDWFASREEAERAVCDARSL